MQTVTVEVIVFFDVQTAPYVSLREYNHALWPFRIDRNFSVAE